MIPLRDSIFLVHKRYLNNDPAINHKYHCSYHHNSLKIINTFRCKFIKQAFEAGAGEMVFKNKSER